jgi:SOS-response transcriptional repressor LexA
VIEIIHLKTLKNIIMKLHPIQKQLLQLAREDLLEGLSLREIGSIIEVDHPQKVKYHLSELENKGFIKISPTTGKIDYITSSLKDFLQLPLYGMAQCGSDGLFAEENICETIPFPSQLLKGIPQENLFLVRAQGNSMLPKISEGDLVVVQHKNYAQNDDLCLVLAEEEPRIKQVLHIDENTIALKSFNSDFKTQILPQEEVHILGEVKKILAEV